MRKVARQRIMSLMLVATCLALAGVIYAEVTADPMSGWPTPSDSGSDNPSAEEALPIPQPGFTPPPKQDFAEIVSRPLFYPSRRPPERKDEPTAPVVKSGLDHVALVGVLIFPTEKVALFERPREPNVLEVRTGEKVEGWLVESIMPDKVVLRRGDLRTEMTFVDKPRPKPRRALRSRRPTAPLKGRTGKKGASQN